MNLVLYIRLTNHDILTVYVTDCDFTAYDVVKCVTIYDVVKLIFFEVKIIKIITDAKDSLYNWIYVYFL